MQGLPGVRKKSLDAGIIQVLKSKDGGMVRTTVKQIGPSSQMPSCIDRHRREGASESEYCVGTSS